MRFSATVIIAALAATVAGLPVSSPADISPAFASALKEGVVVEEANVVETRANTPADVKKHDDNHAKKAANNCGQGCEDSLKSFHSQASKDSKASKASKASQASKDSKASKASQASKNSQNSKNSKPRDVANLEEEMEE
ncbi:hypothetical protein CkaCkLH20_03539 [Colletotrichum karsti]|uniref:Uncharacterized protein n=1 Tax=Colletotrichum karsti TaxID=1095194 RepID=A0A9P6IEZ5_9PEZI|nr:uncharacterized protein CkaCkLH20_03539 [Colletotrichum karsti]KAF9879306.1 hypothetical protein CkaCkLH20_03539 [Colletotrichum karsti]